MKRLARIAAVAAVAGAAVVANASAASAATIAVGPGQSIQAAVNRANPGDTVLIKPGVYHQSVLVTKSHLRIRGAGNGPRGTVLIPGNPNANMCAKNNSGICVVAFGSARVSDVMVDDLRTVGYGDTGVFAFHAQNLIVQNVVSMNNGGYGIARFDTTGGALITNTTINNFEAGLYIGDSSMANVFVAGNNSSRNGYGILYRHSRQATFQYNNLHDNCIGILMVAAPPSPAVGAALVQYNTIRHNDKYCKGNPDEIPFDYSGSGIALIGATGVTIGNNAVLNNDGSTPLSGGIVLVDGTPLGAGPSTGNTVRNNTSFGNSPADIVDHSGGSNTFRNNFCSHSMPGGLCRH